MIMSGSGKQGREPIVFGIVGSGWRAEFYLRIAQLAPERFQVCGIVTRDENKGRKLEEIWGIQSYRNIAELLVGSKPAFMVVAVQKGAALGVIKELAAKDIPVLAETPPSVDLEGLVALNTGITKGAKIQVAEQFHLQPMHAARLKIATSGVLGAIHQAQISVNHSYHNISLIRKFLGIGFENASVTAHQFTAPITAGPGRNGLPESETVETVQQRIAFFDFGGKLGIYDFEKDQHRSWIRSQRLLIRGERGEIHNSGVKFLSDYRTPIEFDLIRRNAGENGNLEGYFLQGILAGEGWVYRNPFIPARLSDEEIAIASCLEKMDDYLKGGPSFYSLAEASQDLYLALMMEKAVQDGTRVRTEIQPWAVT